MLSENTPHVNYISKKYFLPRKSVEQIKNSQDGMLQAFFDLVQGYVENHHEKVEIPLVLVVSPPGCAGKSKNTKTYTDLFSYERWNMVNYDNITLNILNKVLEICYYEDNHIKQEFCDSLLYKRETLCAIYALARIMWNVVRINTQVTKSKPLEGLFVDIAIQYFFIKKLHLERFQKFIEDSVFIVRNKEQKKSQLPTYEENDYTIPHQDVIVSDDVNASKAKIKELEIEIRKLTEIIETYNKAPIAENPHDKVRLEFFCKLMETSGATFQKHGNKAKIARIASLVTELPLQTCANYMTERNLNTEAHKEEILNLNSELQSINSSIRL